ncbi:ComEC/Rec2 family competence protein [Dongia soli]|uniref:ComEC/Rec2 family competence protein n=1 Tax=Dongia soli TaxID=600628 RepID=A0ABU5EA19_9PROT|nr:ComEC/Rec2 family competence protein [Dongia soli]MDY0883043.1 ComEC/Rec2 family competence protein [Dongia soli]
MRAVSLLAIGHGQIVAQRENWPCWLAVVLGCGIACYFSLPVEPPLWLPAIFCALGFGGAIFFGLSAHARILFWPALFFGVLCLGFADMTYRTLSATPHMLAEDLPGAYVSGRVARTEPLPNGLRLTLSPAFLGHDAEDDGAEPFSLRITVLRPVGDIVPGDWVRLRADLRPPSPPPAPGAYDFRRQAFFDGLDGTGFAFRAFKQESAEGRQATSFFDTYDDWADTLRQRIGDRISAVLPGPPGALAIALVVGNQTALRKADLDAMRDSGLAHLLSISGLHISLAAGLMFFSTRFLLALFPWLALRAPIKKWAAVMALAGAFFYAILAGATVPTQRSVIMTGIVFGAILLDRSPISLRLVAWSAIMLLLWQPESLIGPSFQMSFAAVLALVAVFDALRQPLLSLRRRVTAPPADIGGRVLSYGGQGLFWLATMVLSSLAASLATAPFGLYHFNRLQFYGIAANMLAVPITGFLIMPAAVIALLLMPLGLDGPALHVLGWGCAAVLWVAHTVQDWPQAVTAIPTMPSWGLIAATTGFLWLCLGKGKARALGLAGFALMVISIFIQPVPDVFISASGRLLAMRGPDGQLGVSSNRSEKLVRETWLRRVGQDKSATFEKLATTQNWISCSYPDMCEGEIAGRRFFFDLGRVPSPVDCTAADLIIVPQRWVRCPPGNAATIIDRRIFRSSGAMTLRIENGAVQIDSVAASIGKRPWSAYQLIGIDEDQRSASGSMASENEDPPGGDDAGD